MLVDPGLESTREPGLVHYSQPSLQVISGCLDGVFVIQSTVKYLPKALHWSLGDWWDLILSQPEAESVCHLPLL